MPETYLAYGYYLVRKGDRWSVARWKPSAGPAATGLWLIPWKDSYPPGYWDEIGVKVA